MGSIGIAAAIAKWGLVVLLTYGYFAGRIGSKTAAVLGVAAYTGLPQIPNGASFVTSALAVIDIALVLAVFKRDVRIP